MAEEIEDIAKLLGAQIVGEVPDVDGGAFGAVHLARLYQKRMEEIRKSQPPGPAGEGRGAQSQFSLDAGTVERLGILAHWLHLVDESVPPASSAAVLVERIGALMFEEIEHYQLPSAFVMEQVAGEIVRNVLRRLMNSKGSERQPVG